MMTIKRLILLLVLSVFIAGCGALSDDTRRTPIFVTATPRVVFVTETPLPGPTSVLAPTLPSDATEVAGVDAQSLDFTGSREPFSTATVITNTPTFTPTPTNTPVVPGTPLYVPVGGVSVQQFVPGEVAGACPTTPSGGFSTVYGADENIALQLACPTSGGVTVQSAYQTFERGIMIWVSSVGPTGQSGIFVLYGNNTFQRFADTWRDGIDPSSGGLTPPDGLQEPIRGFGKVWRESGGVRNELGWATGSEQGGSGAVQVFERGEMMYISQTGQTYVLTTGTPGTWQALAVGY